MAATDPLPEADDIVERFERFVFDFDTTDYHTLNPKDDLDRALVHAIKHNEVGTVDEILTTFLKDPNRDPWTLDDTPILLLAVVAGHYDVITCLIDHGADIRECDWNGNTPLHMAVWNRRTPYFYNTRWSHNEPTCKGCHFKLHRPDIVDLLLEKYATDQKSAFENIFIDANRNGVTPFLRACVAGCDQIIMRFLQFFNTMNPKPRFVSTEIFKDTQNTNMFHYILDSSTYHMTGSRLETLKALIKEWPFSVELLNEKSTIGISPMEILARADIPGDWTQIEDIIKLLLDNGAQSDFVTIDGNTFLSLVIKNPELVEHLLRSGSNPNLCGHSGLSPISLAINRHRKQENRSIDETNRSIEVTDLLLRFGANLNTELYLYPPEERPVELDTPENAYLFDSANIDPNIMKALVRLRKCGILGSLKRRCRIAIRRFLKPNVDERIRQLNGVPDSMKKYLLVEHEPCLLGISE